jgi:hypothetical protein
MGPKWVGPGPGPFLREGRPQQKHALEKSHVLHAEEWCLIIISRRNKRPSCKQLSKLSAPPQVRVPSIIMCYYHGAITAGSLTMMYIAKLARLGALRLMSLTASPGDRTLQRTICGTRCSVWLDQTRQQSSSTRKT